MLARVGRCWRGSSQVLWHVGRTPYLPAPWWSDNCTAGDGTYEILNPRRRRKFRRMLSGHNRMGLINGINYGENMISVGDDLSAACRRSKA